MDEDSCVLKYIEIVPLDSNVEQTEDFKPFEVKVCIVTILVNHELTQCSSCSMLACDVRSPRIEPAMYTFLCFHKSHCDMGCTLTVVPRLTQPSTLRGTVNEYQPHGRVIIHGNG